MKKKFKEIFFLILLFLNFENLFANSAKITYVRGNVEVNRGNGWLPVKKGDEIFESDILSTGFRSELRLNYNGSIISLAALTRISFEKLTTEGNKDIVDLYVDAGMIRAKVSKVNREPPDFRARTSVSVASVRGTDFIVVANGKVSCNNGRVGVISVPNKKENKQKSKRKKKNYAEVQKAIKEQNLEIIPLEEAEILITANQTTLVNKKGKLEDPILTSKLNENNQFVFTKVENQKTNIEIKNKKIEEKFAIPIIVPTVQNEESSIKKMPNFVEQIGFSENNEERSLVDSSIENFEEENKKKEGPKPVLFPYLNLRGNMNLNMFTGEKTNLCVDFGCDFDVLDFQWFVWETGVKYFYREYEKNGVYAETALRVCVPGRYFEPYFTIGATYKVIEIVNLTNTLFPSVTLPISLGVVLCSHLDFRFVLVQDLFADSNEFKNTFLDNVYFSIGYKIPLRNNGLLAK